MTNKLRRRTALGALAALGSPWALAQAQQAPYPSRPVQLIHGFGAGGNADVVARLVAIKLQELIGQSVVVDIKSGAGGIIATNYVAKSAPDGYNLAMGQFLVHR